MDRLTIRIGLIALGALLALAAFASPFNRNDAAPDLRIYVTQLGEADLRVVYEWCRAQREMNFSSIAGGYRERRWTILTDGFEIVPSDSDDRVRRSDGARFKRVEVIARPDLVRLDKEYQPVVRYGEGGALLYTGHFWPMNKSGGRINATFDLTPNDGAQVVAFGDRALRIENWRSPEEHPAFVYMGPLAPVETDDVMAVIDPEAPDWIVREFNDLVPQAFAALSELFGFTPETKPNLFLSADQTDEAGRLSYAGDALPSQFQIMLRGGVWAKPNKKARELFVHSTIHEAVHLWQAAVRPSAEETPEWIHEGAADAITAEALVALGRWDREDFERNAAQARDECASELEKGSLNGASERGDFRALYACGQVIAEATARAEGKTVADFWRALIAAAGNEGYTEETFYALIEDRTGDEEFAASVRYFARTPLAEPEKEIAKLMTAARDAGSGRGGLSP